MAEKIELMGFDSEDLYEPFSSAVCIQPDDGGSATLLTGQNAQKVLAIVAYPGLAVSYTPGNPPVLSPGDSGVGYDETLDRISSQLLDCVGSGSRLAAERFVVRLSESFGEWAAAEHESDKFLWDEHRNNPLSVSGSLIAFANVCAVLADATADCKTATLEIIAPRQAVSTALGGDLTAQLGQPSHELDAVQ